MSTTAPLLTELAEQLAADTDGQKRKELLETVTGYENEVQKLLREGVPAGQYQRVEALSKALASAKVIQEKLFFPN